MITTVAAAAVPSGIPAAALLVFLIQFTLLLTLARTLGALARRVGIPRIVGELTAGVLLGPSLLGAVAPRWHDWLFPSVPEQFHLLDIVGTIGMLLLVGLTAMDVDLTMLRRRRADAARVSAGGMVIPLVSGVALGFVLPAQMVTDGGNRLVFALFLGVALSVSAIPVIAKTLSDMNLMHRNVGQLMLVAGFVDDTMAWFLLSIIAGLAGSGVVEPAVVLKAIGVTIGFLVIAATIGRFFVVRGLRYAARRNETGSMVSVVVLVVIAGAAISQALGLEAVLGAFAAGLLVGGSKQVRPQVVATVTGLTHSVLAPIFFATVGLRIDLTALAQPMVLGVGGAVLGVAILGKFTGAYLGARLSRIPRWEALALGAGMNARGAVEIVVASIGVRLNVLTPQSYMIIVAVAVVTSLIAPPLLRLTMARVAAAPEEDERLGTRRQPGHLHPRELIRIPTVDDHEMEAS